MKGKDFDRFPFEPYEQQREVMEAVYGAVCGGGVTVIESPTGTGKTLTLLCGAYAWLLHGDRENTDPNEPDWIKRHRLMLADVESRENKRLKTSALERLLSLISDDEEQEGTVSALFDELNRTRPKIIYASRTHSQLSQVMAEIRKVVRPQDRTLSITMAGRSCLCVNKDVLRLNDLADGCMELLKEDKCPYYHQRDSVANMAEWLKGMRVGDESKVIDIEESVRKGTECRACPYYGSRALQQEANIICLPYACLFDAQSRPDLTDSIVVIDEAHNLAEYINQAESKYLSHATLECSKHALSRYLDRYGKRLNGVSASLLQQLLFCMGNLGNLSECKAQSVLELMSLAACDTINLCKICAHVRQVRLPYKLDYSGLPPTNDCGKYPLISVLSFLEKCSENSVNGRIITVLANGHVDLQYVNINPAEVMEPVVKQSRAVILAGGTMSPLDDFLHSLFPGISVKVHSFQHVIDQSQYLLLPITHGPSGLHLDTRHERRSDERMWKEMGVMLLNLARASQPHSMAVFFASSTLLHAALDQWPSTLSTLKQVKSSGLFVEEREAGHAGVDRLLKEFTLAANAGPACLFAVVGGRLSEGVNLSDRLCRLLVIIGLPFPNEADPIVQVRKAHGISSASHNQCMRKVGQCLGRAWRHRKDWAVGVVVDGRWAGQQLKRDLPAWILPKVHGSGAFSSAYSELVQFFKQHKSQL